MEARPRPREVALGVRQALTESLSDLQVIRTRGDAVDSRLRRYDRASTDWSIFSPGEKIIPEPAR